MYKIVTLTSLLCMLIASPALSQNHKEKPSLDKLHKAINKLVTRHYPKATSHSFEDTIAFEYSTRVYITKMISKLIEPQKTTERGPMNDGVWCNIWLRPGDLKEQAAYARSEGEIKREFFNEHTYYPNDSTHKCHLMVTLRLPLKTTDKQKQFVKELRVLLNEFGKYLQ